MFIIFYSKESELSENYFCFKDMDLIHLCKAAPVMEIESTINQCFYRLMTSLNEISNAFSSRKNKSLKLTGREKQILTLLMFGMATKDISDLLSISAKTISSHKINILKKYQTTSLVELYNKWKKFPI
ncbi:LuxR C-terminal-related transcriptional regulator [Yersinia sp. 1652 StPb PI]|uniref:LuxR C-terminal-related transcriptional regulator n=2 Tax=unclassified Yersinia (in: enterobacteria) TaxID=2653513 RepID=UPI00355AFF2A